MVQKHSNLFLSLSAASKPSSSIYYCFSLHSFVKNSNSGVCVRVYVCACENVNVYAAFGVDVNCLP